MRLLGIDFGQVRIGLAVAESEPRAISPRRPIQASGTLKKDAETLAKLAKNEQVDAVVLGVPEHENPNDQGKQQRICAKLAEELRAQNLTVHLQDESLTSLQAEQNLRQTDLSAAQRKAKRDGEAAALILERFLDRQ
jgi:putative Holliday junction resolvase